MTIIWLQLQPAEWEAPWKRLTWTVCWFFFSDSSLSEQVISGNPNKMSPKPITSPKSPFLLQTPKLCSSWCMSHTFCRILFQLTTSLCFPRLKCPVECSSWNRQSSDIAVLFQFMFEHHHQIYIFNPFNVRYCKNWGLLPFSGSDSPFLSPADMKDLGPVSLGVFVC